MSLPEGTAFTLDPARLRSRCGIDELDRHIEEECNALNVFYQNNFYRPKFSFYDDYNAPIGAKALRDDVENRTTIILGLRIIDEELQRNPLIWRSSIIGILAHEWAHLYNMWQTLMIAYFFRRPKLIIWRAGISVLR